MNIDHLTAMRRVIVIMCFGIDANSVRERYEMKDAARSNSAPETYELDKQIGFRLRVALQQHTDIFFRTMEFGLTQAQFASMARLYELGPCSQNQLGRKAALDSASIVGVISRLKARKFVTTRKSTDDRRRMILDLTPEGRRVVRKAMRLGQTANDQTLSVLNAAERRQLLDLLVKLAPTDPGEERQRHASRNHVATKTALTIA